MTTGLTGQRSGLRRQALLLALLPALSIAILVGGIFLLARIDDHHQMLLEQANGSAHHLALASEYGLLSGNTELIASACLPILRENDALIGLLVRDMEKQVLWHYGDPFKGVVSAAAIGQMHPETRISDDGDRLTVERKVLLTGIDLDLEAPPADTASQPPPEVIGSLVLTFSKRDYQRQTRYMIVVSLAVILCGMLLSLWMARRFSQKLTAPILQIEQAVGLLESGRLTTRIDIDANTELNQLARGINQMASRIEQAHGLMQREIEQSTADLQSALQQQRQQNLELTLAEQKANQANLAKDQFLARMSHEIRTPLNAVIGMSFLALETGLNQRQRNYVEKINQAAQSLLGIVNEILDFSKLHAGKMQLAHSDFHLQEVLDHLATVIASQAQRKKLELIYEVDKEVPQRLVGDATRLGQILLNLTGNAVKFTERGFVRLHIARPQEAASIAAGQVRLLFRVDDSGIGIEQEQQQRLFEPFTQADDSLTRRHQGTGLGLAICQTLARLMDGDIELQSRSGQGASFLCRLTFQQADQADRGDDAVATETAVERLTRPVLLAEDHPQSQLSLQRMLASLGCRVHLASDLVTAKEQAADTHDSLLIASWNGVEPAQERLATLYQLCPDLIDAPKILLTPAHLPGSETPQLDGERICLLAKPVSIWQLDETLKHLESGGSQAPPRAVDTTPKTGSLQGLRALLVEDNPLNRELAQDILLARGVRVTSAEHGLQALQVLAQQQFDIVLMDIQMPEMDGYTATRTIRQQPQLAELPIIAITANATQDGRNRAIEAGMNDYISKPITPAKLLDMVSRWLPESFSREPEHDADQAETEDLRRLPMLAEVDAKNCIRRHEYSLAGYRKLLLRFIEDQFDFTDRFSASVKRQDHSECTRLAHSLKGAALAIGAQRLQQAAARLEQVCEQSAHLYPAYFKRATKQLGLALGAVEVLLNHLEQPDDSTTAEPAKTTEPCDDTALAEQIRTLYRNIVEHNWETSQLVEQMIERCPPDQQSELLQKLAAETAAYDYVEAARTCQQLAEHFRVRLPLS